MKPSGLIRIADKPIHRGVGINTAGNVTALCFARPRAISLRLASWTNRDEAVTCKKCLKLLPAWKAERAELGKDGERG
jgi:hypothetical protein